MKLQTASMILQRVLLVSVVTMTLGIAHAQSTSPNNQPKVSPNAPVKKRVFDKEYTLPLRFDVLGDGVTVSPLSFDWDLSSENQLKMSGMVFDDQTFFIGIYQAGSLDRHLKPIFSRNEASEWLLIARWPRGLLQNTGEIEAFNRSGRVLWRQDIKTGDINEWQSQLQSWKTSIQKLKTEKVTSEILDAMPIFQTNIGFRHFREEKQPFWTIQEPFRLCVSNESENGMQTRLCTRFVETKTTKQGGIGFVPVTRTAEKARVIAFNEAAELKGEKQVKPDTTVQFYAELGSGASYEFIAKPQRFNLVEMTESAPGKVRIMAWGHRPNIPVKEVRDSNLTLLEKWIGPSWYNTIGETRQFWEVIIDRANPVLYIAGDGGGLFKESFEITKLPTEKIRPYLRSNSLQGTYIDGAKFYGKAPAKVKISSKMNAASADGARNEFLWEFGAKKRGELNRSYLSVDDGQNTFRAYREVFKGYPGEISTRLTGLVGSGGSFIFMGEVASSYWFESLAGWSNYVLSRNRWGVSAKYFQSLNNLQLGTVTDHLTYLDLALKYRFDPGLWSRDETWGFELATSGVTYSFFQAQLVGGGFFWARSMPQVFDEIFNLLPWMRYPKWVDMEFLYYPSVMGSTAAPLNIGSGLGNWQLNFHGKVMWRKQFFGEAGFGIKQLDFNQMHAGSQLELQFTSFYGTMGLGWSF